MTEDELNELPADSYAGRERDLADQLTDDAMEYYEALEETHGEESASWAIFLLLMMVPDAAEAMTYDEEETLPDLIKALQEDANDSTGEVFQLRLGQRVALRKTLRRLGDHFARRIEED